MSLSSATRLPPSILSKLDRANNNIENFPTAIEVFFQENGYQVICDPEVDAIQPSLRMGELFIDPAPPMDQLSVLAGEIIYHLRSSLDHLVWELIKAAGNDPSTLKRPLPEFPIYSKGKDYESNGKRKIAGRVSPSAQALIEKFQPFKSPDNWPIEMIHRFNIIDKHRGLNVVGTEVKVFFIHDGMTDSAQCGIQGRTVYIRLPAGSEMDRESKPVFHVTLADADFLAREEMVGMLRHFHFFIESMLVEFAPEFN